MQNAPNNAMRKYIIKHLPNFSTLKCLFVLQQITVGTSKDKYLTLGFKKGESKMSKEKPMMLSKTYKLQKEIVTLYLRFSHMCVCAQSFLLHFPFPLIGPSTQGSYQTPSTTFIFKLQIKTRYQLLTALDVEFSLCREYIVCNFLRGSFTLQEEQLFLPSFI